MTDTYVTGMTNPDDLPPLSKAIFLAFPKTMAGNTIGPALSDKSFRAILDALRAIEDRVTTLEA